jgi:hypothetical protein
MSEPGDYVTSNRLMISVRANPVNSRHPLSQCAVRLLQDAIASLGYDAKIPFLSGRTHFDPVRWWTDDAHRRSDV